MKKYKIILFLVLIVLFSTILSSCKQEEKLEILNNDNVTLNVNDTLQLDIKNTTNLKAKITFTSSSDVVTIDEYGLVTAIKPGDTKITATVGDFEDYIYVTVLQSEISLSISIDEDNIYVGDQIDLKINVYPTNNLENIEYKITGQDDIISIEENVLTASKEGLVCISIIVNEIESNTLILDIGKMDYETDPYANVTYSEFYQNYDVASSYEEALYRSVHGFMSGSIASQDQNPTFAENQPKEGETFLRNNMGLYSNDQNTYYIINSEGEVINKIYKGGGYVTLEEVAAYVLAFGDVPANYTTSKKTKPTNSIWKEYLRVNHSSFSGNTLKYPYEPILPNISGCGGDLCYYELDLGTTGTDCDPNYDIRIYNDGTTITRGAARIVYTRFDANKNQIIDINEKYVFYTNNHYNDFREYLNYEGGWGEIFGNITGGGTLSSKYDYNPTPYVKTILKDLTNGLYN